jgi:hypothetical protein
MSESPKKRKKRGPQPDVLRVDLPVAEGLRRLVNASPITKRESRYAKRKPKRTA